MRAFADWVVGSAWVMSLLMACSAKPGAADYDCVRGSEACECADGACNDGLECRSDLCVAAALGSGASGGSASTPGGSNSGAAAGSGAVSVCPPCEGATPVCDEAAATCVGCRHGGDCAEGEACDLMERACRTVKTCDRCRDDAECGAGFVCYDVGYGEPGLCMKDGSSCQAGEYCCTLDLNPPGVPEGFASTSCNPNFTCTDPSGDTRSGGTSGSGATGGSAAVPVTDLGEPCSLPAEMCPPEASFCYVQDNASCDSAACYGGGDAAYCSKQCSADADCADAAVPMRCQVSCPGNANLGPSLEGYCWAETHYAAVAGFCEN
jgi:hypothetical protein